MNKFNHNFPFYDDDSDYNTNANSYYKDLGRKTKLIKLLAKRIWEYENTLNETLEQIEQRLTDYIKENDLLMNERLENWDKRIDEMPEEMRTLFVTWLEDGTLEQIINDDVLGNKADKTYVDELNENVTTKLAQIAVSVTDFGAKGDGVSDDRQAIQDTIDFVAENGGGTVVIPSGMTFILNSFGRVHNDQRAILLLKDKVSIKGKGTLKVADNIGQYHSLFITVESRLTDIVIEGITIDENTTNNSTEDLTDNSMGRSTFYLWEFNTPIIDNITITNITIKDCVGVWQFSFGGITNMKLKDNRIIYADVGHQNYDRTSIYFGCVNSELTGNVLMGSSSANTAIELHGTNIHCLNNTVTDYRSGIYIVNDDQILGDDGVMENVFVSKNSLTNVRTGIRLWFSMKTAVKNCTVVNNLVRISSTPDPVSQKISGFGISFHPVFGIQEVSNIEIRSNTILFNLKDSNDQLDEMFRSAGIEVSSISADNPLTFNNLKIVDNTIVNSLEGGLNVGYINTINHLNISNNYILNPSQDKPVNALNFYIINNVFNVKIKDNTIVDDRDETLILSAIRTSGVVDDHGTKLIDIDSNTVKYKDMTDKKYERFFYSNRGGIVNQTVHGCSFVENLPILARGGSVVTDVETGRNFVQTAYPYGSDWFSTSNGKDEATVSNSRQYYREGDKVYSTASSGAEGWVCTTEGVATTNDWEAETAYYEGDIVKNDSSYAGVYKCISSGVSGTNKPTGSTNLNDGTVTWKYLGRRAIFKSFGTL